MTPRFWLSLKLCALARPRPNMMNLEGVNGHGASLIDSKSAHWQKSSLTTMNQMTRFQENVEISTKSNTIHCRTIQYSTLKYSSIKYNTMGAAARAWELSCWTGRVLVRHQRKRSGSTSILREKQFRYIDIYIYTTKQYNTLQYKTIQYTTIQYSTIQWALLHTLQKWVVG